MGLRCSLLGHDFGEVEVERERAERGSEVVDTITEYRTCDRCGKRHVVGENTEVRTVDQPAEPTDTEDTHSVPAVADAAPAASEPEDATDAETDDGVILEDEPEGRERGQWAEEAAASATSEEEPAAREAEPGDGERSDPVGSAGDATTDTTEAGFTRAGEAPSPSDSFESANPGSTELYCPNCEASSLGDRHSLRPGDICPECRVGYVAERPR